MRRFLLVLALLFPTWLVAPTIARAERERCWPTITYRENGNITVRFLGTIGECIPVWETWGNPPTWEWLDASFVVTSIEYDADRDVTTIKGHPAP